MTSIQDYESDSDSSTDVELDFVDTPREEAKDASQFDFVIFLQNYAANMRHLQNVYVYLPCNALLSTRKLIRQATETALKSIPHMVSSKYDWMDVGMLPSRVKYHTSISGNLFGAPHQIQHFKETFAHGVLKMTLNPQSLSVSSERAKRAPNMQKLLGPKVNSILASPGRSVKLTVEPVLKLHTSPALIKLFLTAPLKMGIFERELLDLLSGLIESASESADLVGDLKPDEDPHVTLNIGTLKDLGGAVSDIPKDIEIIQESLNLLDLSPITDQISLYTTSVIASTSSNNNRDFREVPLPIPGAPTADT